MGKSRAVVAVVQTQPETILADVARLMRLAQYEQAIPKDKDCALKINITWHKWYPAVNTTPWQLEGVIRTLLSDGHPAQHLHGCHNRTVVVSAREGEIANKHKPVLEKYGLRNVHLYEGEDWITFQPQSRMLVLNDVYPKGIRIPKRMIGESIIHLPTFKTHVFTEMTGAMKNAFGGLLHEERHWTHAVIHETLVDLLAIQKEIHSGVFAVMDGTFAGEGPGPRCMVPHIKNVLAASADQVAIDAIAAKMMGIDPMSLTFIRLAHEAGLGVGRPEEIEVVGDVDAKNVNWGFQTKQNTFASRGQKLIYHGALKPLEHALLRSPIVPWSYAASKAYHDGYWWHAFGKHRAAWAKRTPWGELFDRYDTPAWWAENQIPDPPRKQSA